MFDGNPIDAIMEAPEGERLNIALDFIRMLTDVDSERLRKCMAAFDMSPTRSRVLLRLLESPERIVTRDAIMFAIGSEGTPKAADVHICHIRTQHPELWIKTVWGEGYTLPKQTAEYIEAKISDAEPEPLPPAPARIRNPPRAWTKAEETMLITMRTEGKSIAKIAVQLNRSRNAIYGALRRLSEEDRI